MLAAVAVTLDFAGDADLVLRLLLDLGLPLAELLRELVSREVDRRVEIVLSILCMEVLAGQREVNLDLVVLFLGAVLVKQKDDMGGEDIFRIFLEVAYLFSDVGMNGGGELEMAGTEVDLHRFMFLVLF